jgi:class 3 adenylate cyclase
MASFGRSGRRDLLVALLDGGCDGTTLQDRLVALGRTAAADELLVALLQAERSGLVAVARGGTYHFSLTPAGEQAAAEAGDGAPTPTYLVMADLVGFVAYTEEAGDEAARDVARDFARVAKHHLGQTGGRVVKQLGDGIIGTVALDADPLPVLRALAADCRDLDGSSWQLRAAAHRGQPIHQRGDLYGRDVNLVARLCDLAAPGEALVTAGTDAPTSESLTVRGVPVPVAVVREVL